VLVAQTPLALRYITSFVFGEEGVTQTFCGGFKSFLVNVENKLAEATIK